MNWGGGRVDFSTGAVPHRRILLPSERWCCARAADILSLPLSLCFGSPRVPPLLSLLTAFHHTHKRSVMASSNHVTPTNCSWWPISAMDEDGKITDGEECEEPTAEPKPFNKDRLVLYHWTQSFASQKVKKKKKLENEDVFSPLNDVAAWTSLCMLLRISSWLHSLLFSLQIICRHLTRLENAAAGRPFPRYSRICCHYSVMNHCINHALYRICFHLSFTCESFSYFTVTECSNSLSAVTHDILNYAE